MYKRIEIPSGPAVPWQFRFVGMLMIILAIGLLQVSIAIAIVIAVLGFLIVSAYEGTEVDVQKKVYREYTSFFTIKTGKFEPYSGIEKIFIVKSKESQQMYTAHTTSSSVFKHDKFNAYLKFSSGDKILLLTEKNKETLLKKIGPFRTALQAEMIDYTE